MNKLIALMITLLFTDAMAQNANNVVQVLAREESEVLQSKLDKNSNLYFLQDSKGNTIFHYRARFGKEDILRIASKNPLICNIVNFKGESITSMAINAGNFNLAKNLILQDCGTEINDKKGNTLLHLAVKHKNFDLCQTLLYIGANTYSINNDGQSPIELAIYQNDAEIASLLINNGAYMKERQIKKIKADKGASKAIVKSLILEEKKIKSYRQFFRKAFKQQEILGVDKKLAGLKQLRKQEFVQFDLDEDGQTNIHKAVLANNLYFFNQYLKWISFEDLFIQNNDSLTALDLIIILGKTKFIKKLGEHERILKHHEVINALYARAIMDNRYNMLKYLKKNLSD